MGLLFLFINVQLLSLSLYILEIDEIVDVDVDGVNMGIS